MELFVINTGFFKLDGGAMFGVVPKSLWNRFNPADENNLCTWAMRCLLLKEGNRLMLIDTGLGDKQDEKFFSHYYISGDSLETSLGNAGFHPDDITDVFLTHLHFDHVGGATMYDKDKTSIVPRFKNATYWSNEAHWNWAKYPNAREKASFLKENLEPLEKSGQLKFLKKGETPWEGMEILYVDGHTEQQMLPIIHYKGKVLAYVADLLPSLGHIPLPWIMSYDVRPLETLKEKKTFLDIAVENNYIVFFEHDPVHECCTLKVTEKGVRADKTFSLKEIL
ncbi:MBL fold metallo-hydrolase [Cytophagaceae bacterium ABcell3]|nr:MBL fold metallo-hydrolase [Cytophagaceae bacterium ABcell3]